MERSELPEEVKMRVLQIKIDHLEALHKQRLEQIEDDIEDINKTLYNDGQGMVYDVRQLKHDRRSQASRVAAVINFVSVLISFIVMILMIIEKAK